MHCLRLLLIVAVILTTGCKVGRFTSSIAPKNHSAAPEASDLPLREEPLNLVENSSLDGEIKQVAAIVPEELPEGTPQQVPAEAASLISTISLALEQNPDLVAARQSERVGVAAVNVADTYPFNPFLQVQATPLQHAPGGGDPGKTAHYVLLMQRIQLAHQQRFREDAARSSLQSIRWNIHQLELQTASMTAQLYFTLLYRRGLRDIAQASHSNNQLLLESTTKRFEGGDASKADVATVTYDTRATLQQYQLAEANYQSAYRDLLRQLGIPPTTTFQVSGQLENIRWRLPSEDPTEQSTAGVEVNCPQDSQQIGFDPRTWAASRPDVLAAQANVSVARANHNLAAANRVPDVNVGPYYQQSDDGMTFFGIRADTNVPVIDTGRPMQMQRSAEMVQQTVTWRQLQLRAELEGEAAFDRYRVALEALESHPIGAGNALPHELQALETQFRAGEVDVVRAIQSRTSILQSRASQLNLMNEVAQSAAAFVGATGIPFELILASTD